MKRGGLQKEIGYVEDSFLCRLIRRRLKKEFEASTVEDRLWRLRESKEEMSDECLATIESKSFGWDMLFVYADKR